MSHSSSKSKADVVAQSPALSQGPDSTSGLESAFREDRMLGQLVGNYQLLERIGEGATAVVYKAQHAQLGRLYAVKILHPMIVTRPGMQDRFLREAKTAAQLEHDNIIFINDFAIDPQFGPYMVMEFLQGDTLKAVLEQEGPLPLSRVLSISLQVCHALETAHSRGIIHRDLKPENIFLEQREGGEERVKILDFGIARLTQSTSSITGDGKLIGTPLYMSPEQCRGQFPLQPSSDIYSFGITLYEMLTGHPPFQSDSPHKLIIDHFLAEPPDLHRSFPEELRQLQRELLAKEPHARPQSFGQLAQRLRSALEQTQSSTFHTTLEDAPIPPGLLSSLPPSSSGSSERLQLHSPPVAPSTASFHPAVPDSREGLPAAHATPHPGAQPAPPPEGATQEQLPQVTRQHTELFLSSNASASTHIPDASPPRTRQPTPPPRQPVVVRRRTSASTPSLPSRQDPLISDLEQLFSTPNDASAKDPSLAATAWNVPVPGNDADASLHHEEPTNPSAPPQEHANPLFRIPHAGPPSTPTNPAPSMAPHTPLPQSQPPPSTRQTQLWGDVDPIIELPQPKTPPTHPQFQTPPPSSLSSTSGPPAPPLSPDSVRLTTELGMEDIVPSEESDLHEKTTVGGHPLPPAENTTEYTPEELERALFDLDAATEIDLSHAPRRPRRSRRVLPWWAWILLCCAMGGSLYLLYLALSSPALPPLLFA